MSNDLRSPLFMDSDQQYLGNTPGADGKGRLHVKVANEPGEPIPISVTGSLISTEGIQGVIAVGTTPVIAKVGASNLAGRTTIMLQPIDGKIRWGFIGVSPTLGFKLFKDQYICENIADTVDVYIVAETGTVNVTVGEAY